MFDYLAIVQARSASKRLPDKVLKKINEVPSILILLERLKSSKLLSDIVVAISEDISDDILFQLLIKNNYKVVRGSVEDVLSRFIKVVQVYKPRNIIRITGDCPLVDSGIIDNMIKFFEKNKFQYLTNANPPSFPDGLDIEILNSYLLEEIQTKPLSKSDHEHVTSYIRESKDYKIGNYSNKLDLSHLRWTLDEIEDFTLIKKIFDKFHPNIHFKYKDILEYVNQNESLKNINNHIMRNEGARMKNGQKLWKRAKEIIPGGNMLLSKRPEQFLPNGWPPYFENSNGVKITDLDGKEYVDMAYMGVGTNILGYSNSIVDGKVSEIIQKGNMTSLNCPEEVYLAEKMIEHHPWAEQVKFARTGGEANAVAIRIARAASGKSGVAVCGYHGWHDWYLALNLGSNDGLSNYLLSGLEPKGVPKNLKGTVFGFKYNDFDSLKKIVQENDIGVIKMEVERNFPPENNFLQKIRELANANNIVLIFDECTSGYRKTLGGLHKFYEVNPDIAIFSKALGNGYAISSIIGRKSVMESAQSTFISSTFWTERIGPTAALASLTEMEKIKSWDIISNKGKTVKANWEKIAQRNNVSIQVLGLEGAPFFMFNDINSKVFKTYLTQEMLKSGILASNLMFISTEHKDQHFDLYFQKLDTIFNEIYIYNGNNTLESKLLYPHCYEGFQRLN